MPKKVKDPAKEPVKDDEPSPTPSDTKVRNRKKKDKDKDTDASASEKEEKDPESSPEKGKKDKKGKKDEDAKANKEDASDDENYKPKVKSVPRIFVTREIGKLYLAREKYLKLCLIEMFIYLIFLLILGSVAMFQRSGSEYYLTRVMTNLFVERKFQVVDTSEVLSFPEVNTAEQIWSYITNLFLVWSDWSFYYSFVDKEASSNFGEMVFYQNRFIGAIRLRQVRVKEEAKGDCVPELMQKVTTEPCYPAFSSSTERCDDSAWGLGPIPAPPQNKTMRSRKKMRIQEVNTTSSTEGPITEGPGPNTTDTPPGPPPPPEPPADKTKNAWICSKNPEKFKDGGAEKPPTLSTSGEISTYSGVGYYKDFTENDALTRNDTVKERLLNRTWIDRATRAVIIQFTTFNANENLFFTLKLLFELPPTGGVIPSHFVYCEKLLPKGFRDTLLLILFIVFVVFVIYFTISEVIEIMYFKFHYFDYFWNIWDLVILILCYITIGLYVVSYIFKATDLKNKLSEHNKQKEKTHICFDSYNYAREDFITFLSVTFFFAAVKLLKYMSFNHSMFQMQMTLSKATKDIICFSIMFFVVFISFAQLGHLVFGSQVRDFRTFIHSIFALLRTAVGDFDYHQIENVNHFLGPVFFFAYIFFIYFILVNMFLAIIIDTYSEVRASLRDQGKDLHMWDMLIKMCKCGKGKKAKKKEPKPGEPPSPHADIQNLLRRCGFTDMEIDLFFAKFEIPKDKEIPKEEMREKLLTNFNMQPEAEAVKAQEAREKDEIGEKLMERIKLLEDNIKDVNNKIDLIDTKIDNIQQIRARKYAQQDEEKK